MIANSLMAFLHHLCAFTLSACLVYKFVAFRKDMNIEEAKRIQKVDLAYGISVPLKSFCLNQYPQARFEF